MSFLLWNLRLVGLLLAILGLSHAYFPRRFGWREECEQLSPLTREVHFVHNAYIGLFCFLNGILCLFFAGDLLAPSRLAGAVLTGLTVFWGSRLVVQLFVYSRDLWRGKRFETGVHILFSLFWTYLAVVFGAAAWTVISSGNTLP